MGRGRRRWAAGAPERVGPMIEDRLYLGSRLLTIRLWPENVGQPPAHEIEWRGKVCDVVDGRHWHFCGWPALFVLLQTLTADRAAADLDTPAGG